MKLISFFSKFTLICNIAFLLFIFFSTLEAGKAYEGNERDIIQRVPFFKELIITLGFSAIIVNLLMCLSYAIIFGIGKKHLLPKWLTPVNFIFLIAQFYFFFFS